MQSQLQRLMSLLKKSNPHVLCFPDGNVAQGDLQTIRALGEERGGLTMGELSAKLGVTKPSATQAVTRLELVGLAERILGTEDRRKVYVRLTARGQQTYEQLYDKIMRYVDYVLNHMGEADTETLLRLIEKYTVIEQQYINENKKREEQSC